MTHLASRTISTGIEEQILCLAARTWHTESDDEHVVRLLQHSVDWERLWFQGHLHEVLPLLALSMQRLEQRCVIPSDWMARAQRRYYATLTHNAMLADELAIILKALRAANVEAMPVKGLMIAQIAYGNLGLRPAKDIDVLVQRHDLARARAVLHNLGFAHKARLSYNEIHHPYQDPRYFRSMTSGELCVELHWGLWPASDFNLTPEKLWTRTRTMSWHGMDVRVLSLEDTLLHLAIHRLPSPQRLRWLCDIAELLHRYAGTLDWDDVLHQAQAAGACTVLYLGLSLSHDLLGAPVPDGFLANLDINPVRRHLLARTGGVTSILRPATARNLSHRPSGYLRVLRLDRTRQMASALNYRLGHAGRQWLSSRQRRSEA